MARNQEEIEASLIQSVELADPTIETSIGPVRNIMIQPVSNEIARIEAEQERVAALYSLGFQDVATQEETDALATNFGIQQGPGTKARTSVFFFRFTRPLEDAIVRRGTIVSNIDSSLQYVVQEDATIPADNADAFFNASRRTFEVAVRVEAVSSGERFNVPSFRINRIVTSSADFDGVENRARVQGGTERESREAEVDRIRKRFAGLNTGSIDGIRFTASDAFPEFIQDVSIVQPSSDLFRRAQTSPALDVYIVGANIENVRQTFIALGGETEIPLTNPPAVASSLTVQVNGITVSGALIKQADDPQAGSVRADEFVLLAAPVVSGDIVTLTYDFNRLVLDLQSVFEPTSVADSLLFGTDILVKEAIETPVTVIASARVAPSFDVTRVTDAVQTAILDQIEQNAFGITLLPEVVRQNVLSTVSGLTSFTIEVFRKTLTSMNEIEAIELEANEISVLDNESFSLNIR